ncbi:alpha/beta hydrolase family protein [Acidicapsa acidisoli]|uniref:alpha/beta hydrolase family protein n=1 Tax=Acidicapsa acidisoli TaxID=1615681 RepID=UPI0021DF516A|nr:alpha/beta fold hydrolase [Acidicapsa acidisoli]
MLRFQLSAVLLTATLAASTSAAAQQPPAALTADPPADKANPAKMDAFQIPSHGAQLNAIAYLASGVGPHPVVIVLHGFPGNEKNLDLAQSIRRAGWNAIFFDYRGSWGSPGSFSFANSIEDTVAAIAYLRDPANATRLRTDPKRIALVGHSMGGFMAAYAGAQDPAILGIGLISAANMSDWAGGYVPADHEAANRTRLLKSLADNDILPLAGCTAESLADEMLSHRKQWNFVDYAAMFGNRPLLLITSDDGLSPAATRLATTVRALGGTHVTEQHFQTDHSYSDQRIALQVAVLNWLATLQ